MAEQGRKGIAGLLYPPVEQDPFGFPSAPTTESFSSGMARAQFRWEYLERGYEMEFLGGFVGVRQDVKTMSLRPEIGWAVRDAVVA